MRIVAFTTLCVALFIVGAPWADAASGCRPEVRGQAVLKALSPGLNTVSGPLSGFDPCDGSVELRFSRGAGPQPLVMLVHGAGGISDVQNLAQALHDGGVSVLLFDAYLMNGFQASPVFWIREATYEARQRMIYTVARDAVDWVSAHPRVDRGKLYVYGLSNGADVVANLAAAVGPAQVRAVFTEGMAGAGLGLPDQPKVPIFAIFGRLDNYAAVRADDWRWLRRVPCSYNLLTTLVPIGNAAKCNARTNPAEQTQSPEEWIAGRRAEGASITVWFFDAAAHGIFLGPLRERRNAWGNGHVLHANTGATDAARAELLQRMMAVIQQP